MAPFDNVAEVTESSLSYATSWLLADEMVLALDIFLVRSVYQNQSYFVCDASLD